MIEPGNGKLSVARQCRLIGLCRSTWYYRPRGESRENLELMRVIDRLYLEMPWYGSRQMKRELVRLGYRVSRKRVRRLMRLMGLRSVAPRPFTSRRAPGHTVYPYLLNDARIEEPGTVWCADLTYIPMAHGFLYVVAIMDWYSRKVLAWRLSNTQDTAFCVEALREALERYPCPEIFNTDQGSQFTSAAWTDILKAHRIRISMDGKGNWIDNVFIERLWRSMKYECVYLNAFHSFRDAEDHLANWIGYYNDRRPHSSLGDLTPAEVHDGLKAIPSAA